jgi:hypothetical protein
MNDCRWRPRSARLFSLVVGAVLAVPGLARADGGVVRLSEGRGPFAVTILSSPGLARSAVTEVSVMVQNRDTGQFLLDATVELEFCPPAGPGLAEEEPACCRPKATFLLGTNGPRGQTVTVRASRGQAANKLSYSAPVVFPASGVWRLRASVRREGSAAAFECLLPVTAGPPPLARLWPYLALVPGAIGLFVMNQWLRQSAR